MVLGPQDVEIAKSCSHLAIMPPQHVRGDTDTKKSKAGKILLYTWLAFALNLGS